MLQLPIMFLHTPKTGGTALGEWLKRHINTRRIHNDATHRISPPDNIPDIVWGHLGYGYDILCLTHSQIKQLYQIILYGRNMSIIHILLY